MSSIEFQENDYKLIETQEMDPELHFKLVQFQTGYYGIISHNPKTNKERVTLLSPDKNNNNETPNIFAGLGCKTFLTFAKDTKDYMENAPLELVVQLGHDAPDEYREVITRDQAKTLYEKVEICHEIMVMKIEELSHPSDILFPIFMCVTIIMFLIAIVNSLHQYGVI